MSVPGMPPLPDQVAALAALLIPAIRDAVIVTDAEGRVSYWNDGATRVFGWTAEEMVGRLLVDRLPPDAREDAAARHAAVLAGAEWHGEREDVRKDGTRVWIAASVRAVPGPDGTVAGVFGIAEDITERKRAEEAMRESEERLRIALEAAGATSFIWDAVSDQVVRYYSEEPALPANIGAPETVADVLAKVHPDDRAAFKAGIATSFDSGGSEYRNLYRVVRSDGSHRWLQEWGHLDRRDDGTPTRLTGVCIDVTERTRNEDALVRHNRVLEMIAKGTPLTTTLSEVVSLVEEQLQHSLCSILLVDAAGRLRTGAAPSLPPAYNAAVDGVPVGPLNGSCGAAAHYGETIVAEDIETSEVWQTFKGLALAHGLRACLSVPILASGNVPGVPRDKVLGTFAVYRREPGPRIPRPSRCCRAHWPPYPTREPRLGASAWQAPHSSSGWPWNTTPCRGGPARQ